MSFSRMPVGFAMIQTTVLEGAGLQRTSSIRFHAGFGFAYWYEQGAKALESTGLPHNYEVFYHVWGYK